MIRANLLPVWTRVLQQCFEDAKGMRMEQEEMDWEGLSLLRHGRESWKNVVVGRTAWSGWIVSGARRCSAERRQLLVVSFSSSFADESRSEHPHSRPRFLHNHPHGTHRPGPRYPYPRLQDPLGSAFSPSHRHNHALDRRAIRSMVTVPEC